jgi:hypothetical protein
MGCGIWRGPRSQRPVDEIMSILGHKTEHEARVYVQQANRKVMASSDVLK